MMLTQRAKAIIVALIALSILLPSRDSFATGYEYPDDRRGVDITVSGRREPGINIGFHLGKRNPDETERETKSEYPTNQAERPLTVPAGVLELGTGVSVEKTYPTENSARGLLPLRYGITDDMELQPLGLKYRFMLDNSLDAQLAIKWRVAGAGNSTEGGALWITDAGIDGKIGFNRSLAVFYQVDDYHTFYSTLPEKDLIGGSALAVACFSDHIGLAAGGSYQSLTGYTVKSAGYYTMRFIVNAKKMDIVVEGLWSNSNEYVNMRDLERLVGKEVYSGMVYWRF